MTSKKRKDINWPVPLRARDNRLGAAVREYAQSTEEARGEAAAYARVLARVGERSRRVPMLAAGLAMTGVLTVVALVVLHRVAAVPTSQVTVASRSALPVSAPPRRLVIRRNIAAGSPASPDTTGFHAARLHRFVSGRCQLRCPQEGSIWSARPRRFCPPMLWPAVAHRPETQKSCSARAASSFTCFHVLPDNSSRSTRPLPIHGGGDCIHGLADRIAP